MLSSAPSESRGTLKDEEGKNLHISEADWDEVVNNETLKTVRKEMLQGKWPSLVYGVSVNSKVE